MNGNGFNFAGISRKVPETNPRALHCNKVYDVDVDVLVSV